VTLKCCSVSEQEDILDSYRLTPPVSMEQNVRKQELKLYLFSNSGERERTEKGKSEHVLQMQDTR